VILEGRSSQLAEAISGTTLRRSDSARLTVSRTEPEVSNHDGHRRHPFNEEVQYEA